MKKKTFVILLAISCTLLIAACGATGDDKTSASEEKNAAESDETGQNVEEEAKMPKEPAEVPAGLSDNLYDFQISMDGTVYRFPMWYSEFEALGWVFLGDPTTTLDSDERGFNAMWKKDGIQVGTSLFNPSVNTIPYSESIVWNIYLTKNSLLNCDWDIVLPGGIQWKVSGYDDIIAAYGTPSHEVESSISYHLTYGNDSHHQIALNVSKEEDVLEEIEIINLEELEGLDNSVNEEVPDIVKAYQAPESLSDDLHEYNVQLEGVVYALPCPVSVLVENGFTIVTSKSDMELAAGASGSVVFRYGDRILSVKVKNYADYATTIENCSVTSLETWGLKTDVDIVFPGSIKLGDSEDSLKQVLKEVDYFKEKDGDYTYYWTTDAKKTSPEIYTFIVSDNKIIYMDVIYREEPEY